MRRRFRASFFCVLVLAVSAVFPAFGQQLLLVQGESSRLLTRPLLRELPQVELVTETPWTNRTDTYTGVSIADLSEQLPNPSARNRVRLVALNDYSVTAPLDLLLEADATLVYERNGQPMPVREYGPFWLLFPFTERPELVRPEIRDLSVWQLQRMEFLP